jgi:hypothetical protein
MITEYYTRIPDIEDVKSGSVLYGVFRRKFHNSLTHSLSRHLKSTTGVTYSNDVSLMSKMFPVHEWVDKTPDLYGMRSDGSVSIVEVSISRNPEFMIRKKQAKYEPTIKAANEIDIECTIDYFIWDGSSEMVSHLSNSDLLNEIWKIDTELLQLGFKDEEVDEIEMTMTENYKDQFFKNRGLPEPDYSLDNTTSSSYLTKIALAMDEYILETDPTELHRFPKLERADHEYGLYKDAHEKSGYSSVKNTDKLKKVLQLGCPQGILEEIGIDEEPLRPTFHGGFGSHFSGELRGAYNIQVTPLEKETMMMEGPGKKMARKSEKEKNREPPTHLGLDVKHIQVLESLLDMFPGDPENKKSEFGQLLSFYQRISMEMIMNLMKKRKGGEFLWFSSGFAGIWVCAAPGPPLRTESNVMFVKIVSEHPSIVSEISQMWRPTGDHFESKWLSVDTERLTHWSRCHDRLRLTYRVLSTQLKTGALTASKAREVEFTSKSSQLIAMIFLEDKLTTSQTIENTRYVFMKSVGDRKPHQVVRKFPERVNSVIQSYILQKVLVFVESTLKSDLRKVLKLERRTEMDSEVGISGKVNRLFTPGDKVPMTYIINEMYLGCCYNTNRQNKTQDAFKIMMKMHKMKLEMDKELEVRKGSQKSNHIMGIHSIEDDIEHCKNNSLGAHYYSRRAVKVAAEITLKKNKMKFHENSVRLLNKKLSEFATFKASVWEIKESIDKTKEMQWKTLGERSKCIKFVTDLANLGMLTVRDVLIAEMNSKGGFVEVVIQLFKKNQWGGTREILILRMISRIIINFVETLSREICEMDDREMLTEGRNKQVYMKKDHDELLKCFTKDKPLLIIKNSDDMTTWSQKFIPTVFMPIFQTGCHDKTTQSICESILMSHCDKKVEFPKELVKMWDKYPEMKHDNHLDILKESYLETGQTCVKLTSDMGQGIFHFTSSVLALCCDDFGWALFERWREGRGLPRCIEKRCRLSSDDKGELIAVDTSVPSSGIQYAALCVSSEWSRRLHSMELSPKGTSGHFIYEFNSTFMLNTMSLTPLIKFSLAACSVIKTDSFTDAVNESFSRIRQLYENGACLADVQYAHELNGDHIEMVFGSYEGGPTAPECVLKGHRHQYPYDLGVYPRMRPELTICLGPEYYNYQVSRSKEGLENLGYCYGESKIENLVEYQDNPEEFAHSLSFYKKEPLRIPQGFVSQLNSIKKKVGFNFDLVRDKLAFDHLFTMRDEADTDELKLKVFLKLMGRGARLAFKRTSEAIYYGRAGAFRTGKIWVTDEDKQLLINTDHKANVEKLTYSEYLQQMSKSEGDISDWLPFHDVYKSVSVPTITKRIPRKTYRLKPVSMALVSGKFEKNESFRSMFMSALSIRQHDEFEVSKFRSKLDIEWETYPEFLEYCHRKNIKPSDYIAKLMSKFERNKSSSMKCLSPAFSTKSLNDTLNAMVKLSSSYDEIIVLDQTYDIRYQIHDLLKFTDLIVLEQLGWATVTESDVSSMRELLSDTNFVSKMTRRYEKSFTMIAFRCMMVKQAHSFCESHGILTMWYIQKQKKNQRTGTWEGDLKLGVSGRGNKFILTKAGNHKYIQMKTMNTKTFYGCLKSAVQEVQMEVDDFLDDTQYTRTGEYYRHGKSFRECTASFAGKTQVLNFARIPFNPTPLQEGWFSMKINDRGQLEIRTDDVVYLNYAVKFNLNILNNSDRLVSRTRTDIIKLIKKSQEDSKGVVQESSSDEVEQFDYDSFMNEMYATDLTEGEQDLKSMMIGPELIAEDEGFEEFDIGDFFESFSEEPKRYHTEMLRELRTWLYRQNPEDDPTIISKESALRKLQWLYNQQMKDENLDEFSEFMAEEYCGKIGIPKHVLWDRFKSIETESIPIELIGFKQYVRANKVLHLLRNSDWSEA